MSVDAIPKIHMWSLYLQEPYEAQDLQIASREMMGDDTVNKARTVRPLFIVAY